MRIDSPLQGYSAERSPRPGAASTALRESQREVELRGVPYILLRERDIHAVAASRVGPDGAGLYL